MILILAEVISYFVFALLVYFAWAAFPFAIIHFMIAGLYVLGVRWMWKRGS